MSRVRMLHFLKIDKIYSNPPILYHGFNIILSMFPLLNDAFNIIILGFNMSNIILEGNDR